MFSWRSLEKFLWRPFFFFIWRALALVTLVLGLEHSCPWPRECLSSERLSLALALASDFFLCPWPWPRALCPRLPPLTLALPLIATQMKEVAPLFTCKTAAAASTSKKLENKKRYGIQMPGTYWWNFNFNCESKLFKLLKYWYRLNLTLTGLNGRH